MGKKKKYNQNCKASDGKSHAVCLQGLTYSKFINGLNKSGIKLDRKILAEIAYDNPEAFKTIVKKAQSALN